jgi:adenosylcobinamide-GDP ribazoletransferase
MKRTLFLPLVGIVVGGTGGVTFLIVNAIFGSKALAVLLSLIGSMFMTGVFLEAGSIALMVGVFLKYQSLLLIPSRSIPLVLIAAHAFSRFAAGSLIIGTPQGDKEGQLDKKSLLLMTSLGMLPLLLIGNLLFVLLIPLLWIIRTLFGVWIGQKEGGYTASRLLTTQCAVEICFYLLVVVTSRYTLLSFG